MPVRSAGASIKLCHYPKSRNLDRRNGAHISAPATGADFPRRLFHDNRLLTRLVRAEHWLGLSAMFAVIKTGGKQYRVAASDLIEVEKLAGAKGDAIAFGDVLLMGGEDAAATVGTPLIAGASVAGEIVEQKRG